ncbi:MAG: luciferase family oxidoreductase group 1 [Candidatus Azotimanducaceae bacterium]
MLKLGVLDQSPIRSGGTAADALNESVKLAQLAESLGYDRFWVAEHHGSNSFAGSSPEILISRIATSTEKIRVGSGGIMLPHYSPYKIAENFNLLETMFPKRIDLGIGRAPGSDMQTSQALSYGSQIGVEYFPNKVADLKAFIRGEPGITRGLENVKANPRPNSSAEMWMLGSSEQSAIYAAHFELPYSFAHFIAPDQSLHCVSQYFDSCKESGIEPRANLGVFVLCAETEEKANALAACRDLWRLRFEKGDPGPCPSIEEALAYPYTEAERQRLDRRNTIAGTKETVKIQLESLAKAHQVDELVIVTICHDYEDRATSYKLLAEAFNLA